MDDLTDDDLLAQQRVGYIVLQDTWGDYIASYPGQAFGDYLGSDHAVRARLRAERDAGRSVETERIEREAHDALDARYIAEGARVRAGCRRRRAQLEGLAPDAARAVMHEGWSREDALRSAFRAGWREGQDWLASAGWRDVVGLIREDRVPAGACAREAFAQGDDDTRLYYRGGFLSAACFAFEAVACGESDADDDGDDDDGGAA